MAFVVYAPTTGLIDSWRRTQKDADARATENDGLTAHQGVVARPRWAQPKRSYFDPSDTTIAPDRIPAPTDVQITRAVVQAVHRAFYDDVYPRIERFGWTFPYSLKADVEDMLLGAKKAFYMRMLDSTIPHARRRDFARKILFGPSEITGHGTPTGTIKLFAVVDAASYSGVWSRAAPLEWLTWNAGDGAYERRTLQASLNASRRDFPSSGVPDFMTIDLLTEAWIGGIL